MATLPADEDLVPIAAPPGPVTKEPRAGRRTRPVRLPRSPKILVGLGLLALFVLLAIVGPMVAPYDPGAIVASTSPNPSHAHLLGQTQLGQDIWSQLLVGARPTLLVSFLAGAVATVLSILVGITAGYLGGWVDDLLSMLANIFLVLPALPLLIVVGSFMPTRSQAGSVFIGTVIALTGWAWGARVLRAQTLSLRNRDFVEAANISGERTWRIIIFELAPNLGAILAASFLFTVLYAVGTYVALGFLGVLDPAANWSWGSILFDATQGQAVSSGQWWWYVPPGLCIALLGTSLALINFGIDEFINPRLRAGGLTRKAARAAGVRRRPQLGFTKVARTAGTFIDQPKSGQQSRRHAGPDGAHAPLLELHGFTVDYGLGGSAVRAVRRVELSIGRGEVVGLAGESGSGKSTLAYAVTRLLRDPGLIVEGTAALRLPVDGGPDAETVLDLLTRDKSKVRAVRWSEVAVVFQSALHALNPVFRVGDLLDDVLKAHGPALTPRQRRARSRELLELVGITGDRMQSFPHELSGGMRQRVMIAVSIALEPQLLIMDEPTTALDVVIQREILDELMELRRRLGFSVLFITHDLSLLVEVADTIAVMYAGQLVEKAPAQALFHAPRHPYSLGLLSSFPALHGPRRELSGIPGSPPDLNALPSGCPFHPRCPHAMPICRTTAPPSLDVSDASGRREVSCWLHDGTNPVPIELSRRSVGQRVPARPALQSTDVEVSR